MDTPVYLRGRVVTDAGEAPPEQAVVKLNCGNRSTPQDYTDSKGRFNFQPGGNSSVFIADASISQMKQAGRFSELGIGRSGRANLFGCHLEAQSPGYRSDPLPLGALGMGSNSVGVIVLHRLEGLVGDTVSATTLFAPTTARKEYQKGIKALRRTQPNLKQASKHLNRAVEAYPDFAAAWAALGQARGRLQDQDGARAAYTRSLEADPKFLTPYEPLMDLALRRMDWPALASVAERYLKLSPGSSRARYLAALAAASQLDMARAESFLATMKELGEKDDWPLSYLLTALVHEARAEWSEASDEYRAYIDLVPNATNIEMAKRKLHEWELLGVIEPNDEILAGNP